MGHENVQKVKHFLEFIILVAKEYRMSSERPDYLTGVACGYGTDKFKKQMVLIIFFIFILKLPFLSGILKVSLRVEPPTITDRPMFQLQ